MLNVNQTITSIQTGKVDPKSDRDFLVVGSPRSLLVYDVEKNMDLFYKEVSKKISTSRELKKLTFLFRYQRG